MSRSDVEGTGRGRNSRAVAVQRTDWRYEIKFHVSDATAEQAVAWARSYLSPDPHADPSLGDRYRIRSLYFDTPTFDVFHRVGAERRRKYRVRRYGSAALLCLERKLKSQGRVRKFRTWIPDDEFALLEDPEGDRDWSGDWFRRRVRFRHLVPVCCVSYERVARVGDLGGHPVRFTVDRQIRATCTSRICISEMGEGVPILDQEAILELKFPLEMPEPFRELLGDLSLAPGSVSKYRLAMAACGLTRAEAEPLPAIVERGAPAPRSREVPPSPVVAPLVAAP